MSDKYKIKDNEATLLSLARRVITYNKCLAHGLQIRASGVKKFDTIFLWLFSLKGIIAVLAVLGVFYILVFQIIRYKVIDQCKNEGRNYYLSIDMKKSDCVFCKSSRIKKSSYYYILTKENEMILRFRIKCIDEIYRHPYISSFKNDTIIIGNRKFSQLVLLKVPINKNRIFLKDIKYEFIDKSGLPKDTSIINYDLHRLLSCYEDY